jgi:pimeloyl-ACP methyl ester carboxylesterase
MSTVAVPGCELHYDVADLTPPWMRGPETILFVHGLGACGRIWSEWLPVLADRYKLVCADLRGHGGSRPEHQNAPFTLEDLTRDVFAIADAAGLDQFHLVGESMGGTLALNAALHAPRRVRTLTVSNGAHLGASIANVRDWATIIAERGMDGWSQYMMEHRFFPGVLSDEKFRWYRQQQASAAPEVLLRALDLLVGANLSAELGRLNCPALLLHPDSSPFIPIATMAEFKAGLRDSRLRVFAHARHGLPFSHAQECATELRTFLEDARR